MTQVQDRQQQQLEHHEIIVDGTGANAVPIGDGGGGQHGAKSGRDSGVPGRR